jgi:hypothetical protein
MLFPKETTLNTTLSQLRPGPSPTGPAEKASVDHRDRPKPDLMSSPTQTGRGNGKQCTPVLTICQASIRNVSGASTQARVLGRLRWTADMRGRARQAR